MKQDHIAFIGFGEAASAVVEGWNGQGPQALQAFDIKTNLPAERAQMVSRYQALGVSGHDDVGTAIQGAPLVFSFVPASAAEEAAASACASIAEGALFFDCNSVSPNTKRRNADRIEAAGGRYVDVAVMAPVYPKRHRVPLLVSGPHVTDAIAALSALQMQPTGVDDHVGSAAAIKLIRSIAVKGMEAVMAECVLAGRAAGCDDKVLQTLLNSTPEVNWPAKAAYDLERMMVHGNRRADEMAEAVATIQELGLPADIASATVEWQRRIGDMALDAETGAHGPRADAILKRLTD